MTTQFYLKPLKKDDHTRLTNLSVSRSRHSGVLTFRNLFVLKISDKAAAVADMITTTVTKLETSLKI